MTTSDAKAPGGLDVTALLAAPGLTSTLGDRLQAADANGDGVISASEMLDVLQSEADAIRDNKMMKRALIALGVACLLIIAAVVGLTYAVVEMSKDTSVQNNVLVSKDGLQPLSTAKLQKTVQLADLYKASSPSELDWLTHLTVPFGKGEAVLKIQNVYLVPGKSVRFDTAADDVSVEVTADGVMISGDDATPGGRRRLMVFGLFSLASGLVGSKTTGSVGVGQGCAVDVNCQVGLKCCGYSAELIQCGFTNLGTCYATMGTSCVFDFDCAAGQRCDFVPALYFWERRKCVEEW